VSLYYEENNTFVTYDDTEGTKVDLVHKKKVYLQEKQTFLLIVAKFMIKVADQFWKWILCCSMDKLCRTMGNEHVLEIPVKHVKYWDTNIP
jgi:hypothetical protein